MHRWAEAAAREQRQQENREQNRPDSVNNSQKQADLQRIQDYAAQIDEAQTILNRQLALAHDQNAASVGTYYFVPNSATRQQYIKEERDELQRMREDFSTKYHGN